LIFAQDKIKSLICMRKLDLVCNEWRRDAQHPPAPGPELFVSVISGAIYPVESHVFFGVMPR
jgi:hypothetical protein